MREYSVAVAMSDTAYGIKVAEQVKAYDARFSAMAYKSAEQMLTDLAKGSRIDILIIDAVLDQRDFDGVEFAIRLSKKIPYLQVIFTCDQERVNSRLCDADHTYVLTNPVCDEALQLGLTKAVRNLGRWADRPLGIKVGGKTVQVIPSRIIYIESSRRKIVLHGIEGRIIETYYSLRDFAAMLPDCFVQCHKSYIINMQHVEELEASRATMDNGDVVPVGQARRKETNEAFNDYFCGRI